MTTRTADIGGGLTATWDDSVSGPLVVTYDGVGTGISNDYGMLSPNPPWDNDRSKINGITLPKGIKYIGAWLFSSLPNASANIVIPRSVTSIGKAAFWGCKTTLITFKGNEPTIGSDAFLLSSGGQVPIIQYHATVQHKSGWSAESYNSFPHNEYTWIDIEIISIPTPMKVNVNGVWKEATPFVKVNGVWKETVPYVKTSGGWKQ